MNENGGRWRGGLKKPLFDKNKIDLMRSFSKLLPLIYFHRNDISFFYVKKSMK